MERMPRIQMTSLHVDDQTKALAFYTDVLGFVVKQDVPAGNRRWITVVSADDTDGPELVLEPADHKAVKAYRRALKTDRIPMTSFAVDDVLAEHERLTALGVRFVQKPVAHGPVTVAVLDDTCGNLLQIASPTPTA